jgi:hypothetical protein
MTFAPIGALFRVECMHSFTVGYFIGSPAKNSINRKLALAFAFIERVYTVLPRVG